MTSRSDPEQHAKLIEELVQIFRKEHFTILAADGIEGLPRPKKLHNDGYGDQEDKTPDLYAYDDVRRVHVIGEAKTGKGDFESEHALTQYNVFLDQVDRHSGRRSLFYVIVPWNKIAEFNSLITHYIHPDYWSFLTLVSSEMQTD